MQTTEIVENVTLSLPNSDMYILRQLSKKMGWTMRKQRLEKALDDVKAGCVYEAKSVEDLFEQLDQ